ncbi:MAG: hypothetical protein GVY13_08680 [Alphaproteobacteria bacterium]|jgi:hypothetical protein|nr:hypothetical protein [Alphaproteobacteria bacterium]
MIDPEPLPMALLPPVLQQIAEIAGPDAAVRVARELGGRRIYVAPRPGPRNPLTRLLGGPVATAISERLGAGDLEVPSARPLLNWYAARRLRRAGWTTRMIAQRLNLTERRIRQLVAGIEPGVRPEATMEPEMSACPVCGHAGHARPTESGDGHPETSCGGGFPADPV